MSIKFIIIWILLLVLIVCFSLWARKYANPYKLIMIFGKKGSGKSTLLTRLALKYVKSGRTVYSNTPVYIDGVRLFKVEDIGNYTFPPYSVVFIDEVGMIWDNREFKNFRNDVRDWFKLQRHHKVVVYLFSQTFDIDLKLRNLTDLMYMCTCHFNVLSIARRVNRKLVIVEPQGESEGRIADGYVLQPLILQFFGMRSLYFTWIPKYKKFFKSDLIEKPLKEIKYVAYHESTEEVQEEDSGTPDDPSPDFEFSFDSEPDGESIVSDLSMDGFHEDL